MTSKPLHVRLEVMVDGHDGALCGDACHYLAHEDRGDGTRYWCTSRADGRMVRALLHRDAETFRSAACRALTDADALNAAVVASAENLERNPGVQRLLRYADELRALLESERSEHAKTRAALLAAEMEANGQKTLREAAEKRKPAVSRESIEYASALSEKEQNGEFDPPRSLRRFVIARDAVDERDALALELEKAMAVVEKLIATWIDEEQTCPFCAWMVRQDGKPMVHAHCELLAQGFIDRDGRRLETAGKEGK